MLKNYEKQINEKWRKALKYKNLNENLFPNKKDELELFEPFVEGNIANIKKGEFISKQIREIILEITNLEVIN